MHKVRIPPPVQGLFWGLVMWGVAHVLPQFSHGFTGQRPIGFMLIGIGLTFDFVSIAAFIRAKTTPNPVHIERASKLVTGGLYRISRNPMYLGLALILSGVAILLGNPINLIALALFIWGMNILQIRPGEALLSDKFGSQYYLYSQRVRRWI